MSSDERAQLARASVRKWRCSEGRPCLFLNAPQVQTCPACGSTAVLSSSFEGGRVWFVYTVRTKHDAMEAYERRIGPCPTTSNGFRPTGAKPDNSGHDGDDKC